MSRETICRFCDKNCFVSSEDQRGFPPDAYIDFENEGWPLLATCEDGRQFDRAVIGWSIDDQNKEETSDEEKESL